MSPQTSSLFRSKAAIQQHSMNAGPWQGTGTGRSETGGQSALQRLGCAIAWLAHALTHEHSFVFCTAPLANLGMALSAASAAQCAAWRERRSA